MKTNRCDNDNENVCILIKRQILEPTERHMKNNVLEIEMSI